MKKKLLICLAMLVCILGLTACGQEMTENSFITKDQAKESAEKFCESLGKEQTAAAAAGKTMAEYAEEYAKTSETISFMQYVEVYGEMYGISMEAVEEQIMGMRSLGEAEEELGNFVSVLSDETEVTITEDKADVKVKIQGDKQYKGNKQRTATVDIVILEDGWDSITVSVDYGMGELMTKAALNTLLGMGTVFLVLILISALIYCFTLIPKIQEKFRKKVEQEAGVSAPAKAEPAAAAKEVTEDTELIAVIAAAIAASEGAVSADGYVVRSIIRR